MNREAWLTAVAEGMRPLFKGMSLAKFRVTCGWPSKNPLGRNRRVVGQCFATECSRLGIHELFISPLLEKPDEVAGTLCHELAHVAAGVKAAHGKGFVRVCRHVGLTCGKPGNVMPGAALAAQLAEVTARVGTYPHSALAPVQVERPKVKSVVGLECPECQCKISISVRLLERCGAPTCACGAPFEENGKDV